MSSSDQSFLRSFIAGGLAGCSVDFALFPLDSIKTRIQAVSQGKTISYSNPYAGLMPSLAVSFPAAATFWSTYTLSKRLINYSQPDVNPTLKHILSASTASFLTSVVRNPFELIKQQLQAQRFKTSIQASQYIYKTLGFSGFFVGLSSLVMREIPFDVIQFVIYEYLKQEDYNGQKPSLQRNLVNGAIAGGLSAFITTPIDVVKTKMMVYAGTQQYTNPFQILKDIYKTEGVYALWRSWKIRVLFTTVGGMLFFGTFETVNAYFS